MINSLGYGSRPQLLICFCSVSLLILRHANYGTYRINQLILSLFLVCPNKLLTIYSRCNSRASVLVLKKKTDPSPNCRCTFYHHCTPQPAGGRHRCRTACGRRMTPNLHCPRQDADAHDRTARTLAAAPLCGTIRRQRQLHCPGQDTTATIALHVGGRCRRRRTARARTTLTPKPHCPGQDDTAAAALHAGGRHRRTARFPSKVYANLDCTCI